MKLIKFDVDRWEEILVTITRNKTRSLLTAFGVFWGIFMLVALMGGGNGLRTIMSANFEGFATNSCFVFSNQTSEPYKGFRKGRYWDMELTDVERVRRSVKGIDAVTPTIGRWSCSAVYGDHSVSCIFKGMFPEYQKIEVQPIRYGRFINDSDIREKRKVCVIGSKIYDDLFPRGGDPCGNFVSLNGIYFQIVGVNGKAGNGIQINGSSDETVILPYTTMQQVYNMGNRVQILCVTAKEGYTIADIQEDMKQVIKRAHYIHPDDEQAVQLLNTAALFGMVDSLFQGIDLLVWMVGLGTLLAGVIGVSNIMMVTVRERTTEFGIRRAIGAKPHDILIQILSESMVLTLIAGFAGISFAVLALNTAQNIVNASGEVQGTFLVSFYTAVGAALLVAVLGVSAGIAPALRAMSVKPIDAIRDE